MRYVAIAIVVLDSLAACCSATEVNFSRDILPILSDACFQCHGPDEKSRESELRFDDEQNVKSDRGGYKVVEPGSSEASELFRRITCTDEFEVMPPQELGRPLSQDQVDAIRAWIDQGAPWGRHWSFNRVQRPSVPVGVHPVDYFIDYRLVELAWEPAPRADKRTLVRRLSLDLTGLPPRPEQVKDFVADTRPDSWERLVDKLLASQAFGERMAWDWLDAARYSDTNGYQGDAERTMWPWRDWVVGAFNQNMPFDQFTVWQLAGDLLPDPSEDQLLATAFNRNHMINGEGGRIAEENRVDYVMDMAETMSTVWLGLTLNCCRCHDHKYDPLLQKDYYAFSAFFNQTPVTGEGGNPQTPPVLDLSTPADLAQLASAAELEEGEHRRLIEAEERLWPRPTSEPSSKSAALEHATPYLREAADRPPRERDESQWKTILDDFRAEHPDWAEAYEKWRATKDHHDEVNRQIPRVMVMRDTPERRDTFVLERGLYSERRDKVSAGVPGMLSALPADQAVNRLALAKWLVSRDHPLTARVTVNRFWQMLFGVGLVKTAENFGAQGEYPKHPELLDWLAAEFMESGWDTKHLLRTIVTSETYRRSSAISSVDEYERDPNNRFLTRGPRFRLPSWMIRDQALAVSGLLVRELGGKPVKVYQPPGVWEEATFGKKKYEPDGGKALYRRSLYVFWRRIVGPTVFFDSAKRQVCEVKVLRTNTPMHSLATLNDVTYVEAARVLAQRVLLAAETDQERLDKLASIALLRPLQEQERSILSRMLAVAHRAFEVHPNRATALLGMGDSPRDDSLSATQHAAWTTLCLTLLNSDEMLTKE